LTDLDLLRYDEGVLNELIFFITVVIELFFLLYMLRLGKQGLMAIIVVNVILVSCFGALLIQLFGLTTNAGNVFYATIFLAAQITVERFGRAVAFRSIWIGFSALVLFVLMTQYSIRLAGAPDNSALASAIQQTFAAVPRIAVASMCAYVVSQNLNIWLFATLRQKTGKRKLWMRALLASGVGQLVDSILFFSIAFAGTMSNRALLQALLAGCVIKLFVAFISLPILYMSSAIARPIGAGGHEKAS
jgi:queuosine precursor transporter